MLEAAAAIDNASPAANRIVIVMTVVDPLALFMQSPDLDSDIGSFNLSLPGA
jgi:hypothetical protein